MDQLFPPYGRLVFRFFSISAHSLISESRPTGGMITTPSFADLYYENKYLDECHSHSDILFCNIRMCFAGTVFVLSPPPPPRSFYFFLGDVLCRHIIFPKNVLFRGCPIFARSDVLRRAFASLYHFNVAQLCRSAVLRRTLFPRA